MKVKNKDKEKKDRPLPCHSMTVDETLAHLKSSLDGLGSEEVKKRQEKFGKNILPGKKAPSIWMIILNQFKSPLIYILIVAGAVSIALNEIKDAIFIFVVIFLNAGLGTFQEWRAEKSASMLQELIKISSKIIRNGVQTIKDSEELIPGDIVLLEPGDKVPADLRLINATNLTIDESILTGESVASEKHINVMEEETPISDCSNMAFAGTEVVTGKARAIITRTGLETEIGKIASSVYESRSSKTPLLIRMEKFSKQVGFIIVGASILLAILAFFRGIEFNEVFILAIALAVSAIPEGLPVGITVALSISTNRMTKRNVIVRKLSAVESLGSCTLIASDKTGTLTMNKQTAEVVVTEPNKRYLLDSTQDINNKEQIDSDENQENFNNYLRIDSSTAELENLLKAAVIDNGALIDRTGEKERIRGNPIDIALIDLNIRLGLNPEEIRNNITVSGEIPFSSGTKFSAKFYSDDGKDKIAAKGAPEVILSLCSKIKSENGLIDIETAQVINEVDKLTAEGYRVIAVAEGEVKKYKDYSKIKKEDLPLLTLLGLIGFIDPLRTDVKAAVKKCKTAGIAVVMITGDHPITAFAIAKELGIVNSQKDIITGTELGEFEGKPDDDFLNKVKDKKVFARVTPLQKLKLVESFIKLGHFVAVTGDGINDAPALKKANIGVAMGSGTDVTKDTASIIVTDDSFASIVSGVEEGRFAYDNIRKVTYLLISTGAAEIILFTFAILAGLPIALLAVQILWLNLVTNGIQHVALAFEKGEKGALLRPPRKPSEGIFNKLMIQQTALSGVIMGIIAALVWLYLLRSGKPIADSRNVLLMLMVFFENIHVFNCRSERVSAFRIPLKNNYFLIAGVLAAQGIHIISMYIPYMQGLLGVSPISIIEWLILLSISLSIIIVMEIFKLVRSKMEYKLS